MSATVFCPLSDRELQALRLTAEGLTAKEIGRACGISYRTVDIHRQHMVDRLEAKNLMHAITLAFRMGLIQ